MKAELMLHVPMAIGLGFVLTTLLSALLFLRSVHKTRHAALFLAAWAVVLIVLGLSGFLLETHAMPPRFVIVLGVPLLCIVLLFATTRGRHFINTADPALLTLLHLVRVPVELVLYGLFVHDAVPELMTFAGRNFDVLSGLTAPLVYWFGYKRSVLPRWALITWNIACLGLLANIVINAILAAPFNFQSQAFEQPNVAIFHFPYVWLPGIVVPLVLCAHLICLRTLLRRN